MLKTLTCRFINDDFFFISLFVWSYCNVKRIEILTHSDVYGRKWSKSCIQILHAIMKTLRIIKKNRRLLSYACISCPSLEPDVEEGFLLFLLLFGFFLSH